jgi:hypothetical protein
MLQARRSMSSFNYFELPNPSGGTIASGFTQSLTEINTRNCFWEVESDRRVKLTTLTPSLNYLPNDLPTRFLAKLLYL